jgi:hypothetical protein
MSGTRIRTICPVVLSLVIFLTAKPVHALTITPTYTSRVSSLSNFSQIQNAVDYVINEYQSLYSDPITLSITIDASSNASTLTTSHSYTYEQLRNAIIADAKTATDASVVASLNATDPTGGVSFDIPIAEAQALGLTASGSAGTYTFGTNFSYTFDPNNRAVAGDYDFIGLTEGAISQIMGRLGGTGSATVGPYDPLDLLRYAAPGVRALNKNVTRFGAYFSIDGGVTKLHYFEFPFGDDWDSGFGFDAYDGAITTGHKYPLSQTDVIEMDAIGYDYTGQPLPEPSTWITASVGALVFIAARVWRGMRHSQLMAAPR